jgi:hypothetical protein
MPKLHGELSGLGVPRLRSVPDLHGDSGGGVLHTDAPAGVQGAAEDVCLHRVLYASL